MKKLLPFIFLFPSAVFADMTSTITSSVKVEVMSAATAADRVGNSYSVSGTGVNTTDGTTAGTLGGLGNATNGVNAYTTITASQLTGGESFQYTVSYLEGDAVPTSAPATGAVANFSDLTSTAAGAIGSGGATIDNHVITVSGGDPGSTITGQYVSNLSVD
tara:strand:+ start:32852 stop:33334 length:483 start_codon:yes stop_codon:yes gene_type:complete